MLRTTDFSPEYWIYFSVLFCILALFDNYIISKKSVKCGRDIYSTLYWFLAVAFCCLLLKGLDFANFVRKDHSTDFFTGYLIELSLSLDNIFVFIIIFDKLKITQDNKRRILRVGIISAVVMRLFMILFAVNLIQKFISIFYFFGLILIMSAIHTAVSSVFVNIRYNHELAKKPFYQRYFIECSSSNLVTRINNKLFPTINLLALILVEKADLLFAVDSIPAVLSVTNDSFIVFTSNIFAIAGLRSLFFYLSSSAKKYPYLKHGIVLILFFIGIKLVLIPQHILIPKNFSLGFILFVMIGSILISKFKHDKKTT